MPSSAFTKFQLSKERALILHRVVGDARLQPQSAGDREAICHAAHAALVAAWNAYIVNVVKDFIPAIARPNDVTFNAVHTLVADLLDAELKRFNTPNAENARKLLVLYTGYDPLNDWIWPQRSLSGLEVRERLNEILKVRHSFAHGFPIPAYSWTSQSSGKTTLTKASVQMTGAFVTNLSKRTEEGMKRHLRDVYSISPWG